MKNFFESIINVIELTHKECALAPLRFANIAHSERTDDNGCELWLLVPSFVSGMIFTLYSYKNSYQVNFYTAGISVTGTKSKVSMFVSETEAILERSNTNSIENEELTIPFRSGHDTADAAETYRKWISEFVKEMLER